MLPPTPSLLQGALGVPELVIILLIFVLFVGCGAVLVLGIVLVVRSVGADDERVEELEGEVERLRQQVGESGEE